MDSWADTNVLGKHTYVEEFVECCTITSIGFTSALRYMKYLPIANVLYAYDISYGTTIILEHNNTVYIGNDRVDFLTNPIQSEEYGNRVDLIPRDYYIYQEGFQYIILNDWTMIPILYYGILPDIPARETNPEEIYERERVKMSPQDPWDTYTEAGNFSSVSLDYFNIDEIAILYEQMNPIY